MPHVPSSPEQIAQRILARITAMGGANSAAQNGDLALAIGNVSEELSLADRRYGEFVKAHHFKDVTGPLLRERVAQLPKDFPPPRDAAEATGGNFTLKRSSSVGTVVCSPGSIRVSYNRQSNLVYSNVNDVTFTDGALQTTGNSFTCATPGVIGTAGAGDVGTVEKSPGGVVTYARNMAAMVGHDAESDEEIVRRAERWLWAQAQSQREAVIELTKAFRSQSDPTIIIGATVLTDIDRRGYTEVFVENGAAMVGFTRPAVPRTGIIPAVPTGRRHLFTFDYPAASPPKLRITGANPGVYTAIDGQWTAAEEDGTMWIRKGATLVLTPGDTWETYGHHVYTGITVELQRYYERYCTMLGTRIRARHGSPQWISISADVVLVETPGNDRTKILARTKREIVYYTSLLAGGQTFVLYDLIPRLKARVPGLINIHFDHGDLYAGGPVKKLVTSDSLITLR